MTALLVWFVFLDKLGRYLGAAATLPAAVRPLEMQLVEPTPLPQPTAARAPPEPHSANKAPLKPARAYPLAVRPGTIPQPSRQKALQAAHDAGPTPPTLATGEAKPSIETPPRSAPPDESTGPPAPVSGDSAARVLAQPLPELPDDLREQAYQTLATARFLLHADGSVEVELIKPTPNPRLNQILLTALRQWRFFPAMQGGHPVESRLDIRVHFNVD